MGTDLGVADASTEVYAAMDWLASRQQDIEAQLTRQHLDHVLGSVAAQVGAHLWEAPHAN